MRSFWSRELINSHWISNLVDQSLHYYSSDTVIENTRKTYQSSGEVFPFRNQIDLVKTLDFGKQGLSKLLDFPILILTSIYEGIVL